MALIKRGTTPTLPIKLDGLESTAEIARIEFIFKHVQNETADALFMKAYPGPDVTFDAIAGVYNVALTDVETRQMRANSKVYMDTRIILENGGIPATTIVAINVNDTLFAPLSDD